MRMPYQQTVPRMTSYPDDASQEMALFGSSYSEVRVVDPLYQSIRDNNESELGELSERIDVDSFLTLLDVAPELVFSEEDLEEEEDGLTLEMIVFVYQCRKVLRCMLTTDFLDQNREAMIRGGRLVGDAEFSERMQTHGPDAELWLSASLRRPGEVVLRG